MYHTKTVEYFDDTDRTLTQDVPEAYSFRFHSTENKEANGEVVRKKTTSFRFTPAPPDAVRRCQTVLGMAQAQTTTLSDAVSEPKTLGWLTERNPSRSASRGGSRTSTGDQSRSVSRRSMSRFTFRTTSPTSRGVSRMSGYSTFDDTISRYSSWRLEHIATPLNKLRHKRCCEKVMTPTMPLEISTKPNREFTPREAPKELVPRLGTPSRKRGRVIGVGLHNKCKDNFTLRKKGENQPAARPVSVTPTLTKAPSMPKLDFSKLKGGVQPTEKKSVQIAEAPVTALPPRPPMPPKAQTDRPTLSNMRDPPKKKDIASLASSRGGRSDAMSVASAATARTGVSRKSGKGRDKARKSRDSEGDFGAQPRSFEQPPVDVSMELEEHFRLATERLELESDERMEKDICDMVSSKMDLASARIVFRAYDTKLEALDHRFSYAQRPGLITREQFQDAMRTLNVPLAPTDLAKMLQYFDPDNTGAIEYNRILEIIRTYALKPVLNSKMVYEHKASKSKPRWDLLYPPRNMHFERPVAKESSMPEIQHAELRVDDPPESEERRADSDSDYEQ